ncbi:MAG TPA: hypothetical protein VMD30_11360 [Tepidisphaeraceae bacterium]|nr:hypothetical protein [Tepidisphaeraceae bacterium]
MTRPPQQTTELESLLSRAGVKGRLSIERHLAACDAEPKSGHGKLWRRLASRLGALAPLPCQIGSQAVLFFVPDGKYRMQVFTLEDNKDGVLQLYLPNVLTEALREKIVTRAGNVYRGNSKRKSPLSVEVLDASNTPDPAPHVKQMIGWNRKAIKLTLDAHAPDESQIEAAEALCDLASKQWNKSV